MDESGEGFVPSNNKEQSIGNGNGNGSGFMSQHLKKNRNFSQSGNISGNSESLSKRIKLSPALIQKLPERRKVDSISKGPGPLGLKLTKSPSFLSNLDKVCPSKDKKKRQENEGSSSSSHVKPRADEKDKFKAGNFPAMFLKIGAWERIANHEGELIVKLYYAKRKIVWEVLDGPLKSKLEILWDDICALQATTVENAPGILEIELIRPPVYFRESSPQPRKHTLWQQSSDFTGGQAPIWRRHHVTFPPGILDSNYAKLLQCDKRLNDLSNKPFPLHPSPYFDPNIFGATLSFRGYGANNAAQYPYRGYSAIPPREPLFGSPPNLSRPVMNFPVAHQGGGNYQFAAPNQASWNQSISIPTNNFGIHGTFGIPNNNVCDPSYYNPNTPGLLTGIQTNLLDNVQFDDTQGTVDLMSSLLEPMGVNNNNINGSGYQPGMAFHAMTGDQGSSNNYGLNHMAFHAQPGDQSSNNNYCFNGPTFHAQTGDQGSNYNYVSNGASFLAMNGDQGSNNNYSLSGMAFHAQTGDQGNNNNYAFNPTAFHAQTGGQGNNNNYAFNPTAFHAQTGDQGNNNYAFNPTAFHAQTGDQGNYNNYAFHAQTGDQGNNNNFGLNSMAFHAQTGDQGSNSHYVSNGTAFHGITGDQGSNNKNYGINGTSFHAITGNQGSNHNHGFNGTAFHATTGNQGNNGMAFHAITGDQGNNNGTAIHAITGDQGNNNGTAIHAITGDQANNNGTAIHAITGDQGNNNGTAFHAITGDQGNNNGTAIHAITGDQANNNGTAIHAITGDQGNNNGTAIHAITGDQGNNNYSFNSTTFPGITEEQGSNDNYSALDGTFSDPIDWPPAECSSDDLFQSASEKVLPSASENVFSDNLFEFGDNNIGFEDLFDLDPFKSL